MNLCATITLGITLSKFVLELISGPATKSKPLNQTQAPQPNSSPLTKFKPINQTQAPQPIPRPINQAQAPQPNSRPSTKLRHLSSYRRRIWTIVIFTTSHTEVKGIWSFHSVHGVYKHKHATQSAHAPQSATIRWTLYSVRRRESQCPHRLPCLFRPDLATVCSHRFSIANQRSNTLVANFLVSPGAERFRSLRWLSSILATIQVNRRGDAWFARRVERGVVIIMFRRPRTRLLA